MKRRSSYGIPKSKNVYKLYEDHAASWDAYNREIEDHMRRQILIYEHYEYWLSKLSDKIGEIECEA